MLATDFQKKNYKHTVNNYLNKSNNIMTKKDIDWIKDLPNLKDFLQVKNITKAQQTSPFIEHLFSKINYHINKGGRVLILTLTKKSAEEISNYAWYN